MSMSGWNYPPLTVRWTIGDVTQEGFEALQLSLAGAWRLFGSAASYNVFVNTIPVQLARERTGLVPAPVQWRGVSTADIPAFLRFDGNMAEGVGWKLCPLRWSDDVHELALDNDCILWKAPAALERWRNSPDRCLIAEDVRPHLGRFDPLCGSLPRNSGIRGLPPAFPFQDALRVLVSDGAPLTREGDEQGLQVAAVSLCGPPEVVALEEVTICSPFPPHRPGLGRCGVHFVGLNTRQFRWTYYGQDPRAVTRAHWEKLKPFVEAQIPC